MTRSVASSSVNNQQIQLLQDRVEAVEDVAAERIEQSNFVLVFSALDERLKLGHLAAIKRDA